jgi:acyl phosphate:glycerol-3-phosphate acyltransferase
MTAKEWFYLFWAVFSFGLGSLPFSVWISRWLAGRDVRQVGDHNPGAVNALKAGGPLVGLLALILDVTKGALPVGLAYYAWQTRGWEITPIALAPIFGHAFSPFLRFRGGKALAVTLGVWIGLTLWRAPLAILLPLSLTFLLVDNSGYAVIAATVGLGIYLLISRPDDPIWFVYVIQSFLIIWKHRIDLGLPLQLRTWLKPH